MSELNQKIYQGVAIIDDPSEGHCITYYGINDKRDYDLDLKDGKQPDGRVILKSIWLDKPTDHTTIDKIAHKLFQESYRK